jgi:DMSO/TMAO reductase YedYZ molybdopterin-dependent catalytic subunit
MDELEFQAAERHRALAQLRARRQFVTEAALGTLIAAMGGLGVLVYDRDALAETRSDGRPRVPPGQRVLKRWKPMGGDEGDPSPGAFRLNVHGEVENPFTLDFAGLLALPQTEIAVDVHCVTGWTALGAKVKGVLISALADRAKPKQHVRHVILEGAHGYTSNIPLSEALKPNVVVAHRLDDKALGRAHGAPVRALVPDLYFWKSAKWLTGIRFVVRDEPGYWEQRGYNNHGDPWKEERYS